MSKDKEIETEDEELKTGGQDEELDYEEEDEEEEEPEQNNNESFDLPASLDVVEHFPVTLRKAGGKKWECELREFDGLERDAYLNREKNNHDRKGVIKSFKDVQSRLIAQALWDKQIGERVDIKKIRKFPASTIVTLYNKIIDMNKFDMEKAKEETKND